MRFIVVLIALAALISACGSAGSTDEARVSIGTTIGVATHAYSAVDDDFAELTSPLLAAELDDGTRLVAGATDGFLDVVGLGADVQDESDTRVTWTSGDGTIYLILEDEESDRVKLEPWDEGISASWWVDGVDYSDADTPEP